MTYDDLDDKKFDIRNSPNPDFFPPEILEFLKKNSDLFRLNTGLYSRISKRVVFALQYLMYKQYPALKTETRPSVIRRLENMLWIPCTEVFLTKINKLLHTHNTGGSVRDMYPRLDEWVKVYARPPKLHLVNEDIPPCHWKLGDTRWKVAAKKQNAEILEFFQWEQSRKSEFINLLQDICFKQYPELLDLSSDEWVVFAKIIGEEYDLFKTECEYVEGFIDYNFPEDYINLPFDKYIDKCTELTPKISKKAQEKRNRRIAGEAI